MLFCWQDIVHSYKAIVNTTSRDRWVSIYMYMQPKGSHMDVQTIKILNHYNYPP